MKLPEHIRLKYEPYPERKPKFDDIFTREDEDERIWPFFRFELEINSLRDSEATFDEVAQAIAARYRLSYLLEFLGMESRWLKPH